MVAPSLEMVTLPLSSWMSLSIPLGPSVVRTTSATALHAFMLLTSCAFPCEVSVPSFRSMICGCCLIFFFFFHGHFHKHKGDNVSKSLKQQEVLVIMRVMKTRERERERERTIMADIFVDCGGSVFESERERESVGGK